MSSGYFPVTCIWGLREKQRVLGQIYTSLSSPQDTELKASTCLGSKRLYWSTQSLSHLHMLIRYKYLDVEDISSKKIVLLKNCNRLTGELSWENTIDATNDDSQKNSANTKCSSRRRYPNKSFKIHDPLCWSKEELASSCEAPFLN